MGVPPFCSPGFLDALWRPPAEDSSPNDNLRSCCFGISMHCGMGGLEPPGESPGVLGQSVAGTYSARDFRTFKGLLCGDQWYGLRVEVIPLLSRSACNCVRMCVSMNLVYMFCHATYCQDSGLRNRCTLVFRVLATTTSGLWRQVLPCFQNDDMSFFTMFTMVFFFLFLYYSQLTG